MSSSVWLGILFICHPQLDWGSYGIRFPPTREWQVTGNDKLRGMINHLSSSAWLGILWDQIPAYAGMTSYGEWQVTGNDKSSVILSLTGDLMGSDSRLLGNDRGDQIPAYSGMTVKRMLMFVRIINKKAP